MQAKHITIFEITTVEGICHIESKLQVYKPSAPSFVYLPYLYSTGFFQRRYWSCVEGRVGNTPCTCDISRKGVRRSSNAHPHYINKTWSAGLSSLPIRDEKDPIRYRLERSLRPPLAGVCLVTLGTRWSCDERPLLVDGRSREHSPRSSKVLLKNPIYQML